MSSSAALSSLRQLLAERYPQAVRGGGGVLATGVRAIDEAVGGIPGGAVTEVVAAAASCGSQRLLGALLGASRQACGRVALIDGHDSFDPASWPEDWLQHVVWVRGRDTAASLQAADVMTRDANFALVVLDLRRAPAAELRRTPAPFWYRLQRAVEPADLALVVFTPHTTVPSARLRLQLGRPAGLAALEEERMELTASLAPVVQRQRLMASA